MSTISRSKELNKMIEGCRRKDSRQQESLYRTYAAKMFVVCLRYARDHMEAEDILQTGFIKAFDKITTYKNEGMFEAWLRRIMVNTGIESYRKRKRAIQLETICEDYFQITCGLPEASLEVKDLLKLVQKLPDNYRAIFSLYAIDGYSHKEISVMLNTTELASRATLCRAREMLKKVILSSEKLERVSLAC
ncbi:RNA polymerase sigma factor [Arcticibacter tournemirensis]